MTALIFPHTALTRTGAWALIVKIVINGNIQDTMKFLKLLFMGQGRTFNMSHFTQTSVQII